jgi:hypothetical protein
MKAKDKANKMCLDFLIDVHTDERDYGMNKEMAKQCALIAVDEILNSNPCCEDSDRGGNFQWASNEYYWQEVKQEIQQL